MRLNYKKLGNYIELVSGLNTNLQYGEVDVRGVSNNKEIIQTRANNEGRDFNKFYVVEPNEFIYNSRTSRMGEKVGLGYNDTEKTFITSFNNTVFRVKDEALLPMYLLMWFNRPEFDRYARVHSWGSSTEIFSWEDMCNVSLPIPKPDKQKEIVKEYHTIVNRIALNNQLIQKLEETAQAIYKQWFIDFEFPNQEGKPYKSSGGEMEMNLELEKEIPVGWEVKTLGRVVETLGGGTPSTEEDEYWTDGNILWYSPTDITKGNCIFTNNTENKITKLGLQKSSAKLFPAYSLLMTSRATIGALTINTKEACTNQGFITIIPTENISVYFLYDWVKTKMDEINSKATGSTFPEISKTDFRDFIFIHPSETVCKKYNKLIPSIFNNIKLKTEETDLLGKMKDLLLSKLATIEN